MGTMSKPQLTATPPDEEPAAGKLPAESGSTSADETGGASFPASDPPAVWTWEVKRRPKELTAD